MQLMMFSVDEASKYIDILKSEMTRKDLYSYRDESDNTETFEDIRQAKDANEARVKRYTELQDLMFKLEAVAGYENDELHQAVSIFMVDEDVDSEQLQDSRKVIRDFMLYLVENDFISFESMVDMCKNSEVAQKLFMGM
jgi:hypothetical protein